MLVLIPANAAGNQFTVTLLNDQSPQTQSTSAPQDGALGNPGDTDFSQSQIVVTAVNTSTNGPMAFVVYRAPADFPRSSGQDAGSASRTVYLQIQQYSDGQAPEYTQTGTITVNVIGTITVNPVTTNAVTILRPPVVLVHGNWSNPTAWQFFQPLVSDSLFNIYYMNYGSSVQFGVDYNAQQALVQLGYFIQGFKAQKQVAAVQADVIAYSLGGLIARDWVRLSSSNQLAFLRPNNFNQGDVHKLVTIDTPHWGSEEANQLLASSGACRALFTAFGNPVGQNITDMAVGSNLLQNLNAVGNSVHLPAQVIFGTDDSQQNTAADNAFFGSVLLYKGVGTVGGLCMNLLPTGGYTDLFTTPNNPSGASDLVVSQYSQLATDLGVMAPVPSISVPEAAVHTINSLLFPQGPDVLNRMFDSAGDTVEANPSVSTPTLVIGALNTPVSSYQPMTP